MKENNDEFLPQIQESCLNIVKEIDRVCRENDISYSLCGGSVIGAHLFHNFIPWDDDIDLMMTRENYDKFLDVFQKKGSKRYHISNYRLEQNITVPTLFTRIEDMDTMIVEKIAGDIRRGHVFVDVTVMDNVKSKITHKIAFVFGSYVYTQLYKWNGMIPNTGWKRVLFKLINRNSDEAKALCLYTDYEKFCSKMKYEKTEMCAELMSAAYSKYLYDRTLFDEYVDIEFADTKLMVVKRYMDYLFMRYGKREFTKSVPPEQRFNSHIVEVVSLKESEN